MNANLDDWHRADVHYCLYVMLLAWIEIGLRQGAKYYRLPRK
jgi:hypothetical protein